MSQQDIQERWLKLLMERGTWTYPSAASGQRRLPWKSYTPIRPI